MPTHGHDGAEALRKQPVKKLASLTLPTTETKPLTVETILRKYNITHQQLPERINAAIHTPPQAWTASNFPPITHTNKRHKVERLLVVTFQDGDNECQFDHVLVPPGRQAIFNNTPSSHEKGLHCIIIRMDFELTNFKEFFGSLLDLGIDITKALASLINVLDAPETVTERGQYSLAGLEYHYLAPNPLAAREKISLEKQLNITRPINRKELNEQLNVDLHEHNIKADKFVLTYMLQLALGLTATDICLEPNTDEYTLSFKLAAMTDMTQSCKDALARKFPDLPYKESDGQFTIEIADFLTHAYSNSLVTLTRRFSEKPFIKRALHEISHQEFSTLPLNEESRLAKLMEKHHIDCQAAPELLIYALYGCTSTKELKTLPSVTHLTNLPKEFSVSDDRVARAATIFTVEDRQLPKLAEAVNRRFGQNLHILADGMLAIDNRLLADETFLKKIESGLDKLFKNTNDAVVKIVDEALVKSGAIKASIDSLVQTLGELLTTIQADTLYDEVLRPIQQLQLALAQRPLVIESVCEGMRAVRQATHLVLATVKAGEEDTYRQACQKLDGLSQIADTLSHRWPMMKGIFFAPLAESHEKEPAPATTPEGP